MSQQSTQKPSESEEERQRYIEDLCNCIERNLNKPLLIDVVAALSQRVKDHYSKQDIQFTFQGKNLNLDETFGADGLLSIFFTTTIKEQLIEPGFGFKWYLAPESKGPADVSLRLSGNPYDFDSIHRIIDDIVRLADSLEIVGNRCAVDPLYEVFYKNLQDGNKFDIRLKDDCKYESAYVTAMRYLSVPFHEWAHADMENVRQIRKGILGWAHPSTLEANHQTAVCLLGMGKHAEALSLLEFNDSALNEIHGGYHVETLKAQSRLARACLEVGLIDRSESLLRAALSKSNTSLGEKHEFSRMLSAELDNFASNRLDS